MQDVDEVDVSRKANAQFCLESVLQIVVDLEKKTAELQLQCSREKQIDGQTD